MAPEAPIMTDPAVHGHQPGADAGADAGNKVIVQKARRSPVSFQFISEHEQGQHVEKYVEDAAVQEHVGHELPEHQFLRDAHGNQSKIEIDEIAAEQMRNDLQQIHSNINDDQSLDRSGNRSSEEVSCSSSAMLGELARQIQCRWNPSIIRVFRIFPFCGRRW